MEQLSCPESVVAFLRNCHVEADALGRLDTLTHFYRDLLEANTRINLTSVTDCRQFWVKHVADSLSIGFAAAEFMAGSYRVADVGSGAGFPSIPLAWANPRLVITAIETNIKKAEFIAAEMERLTLRNGAVVNRQAREVGRLPEYAGAYDAVVARAVADPSSLVRECRQLLRRTSGAVLVIYSTPGLVASEWSLVNREARKYSLALGASALIDLPDGGGQRQFFVLRRP